MENFSAVIATNLDFSEFYDHFRVPREDFSIEDVKNFVGKL